MIEVAIMLEGQDGLNWKRFRRIAESVEELGFAGLYRSDHFVNHTPPNLDSLDAWVSMTWLASRTRRIEFGTLVSPVSFRDPVMLARAAMQVDDLSGGRLTLGVGAGWQAREHAMFGYELPAVPQRFRRLREALEVITALVRSNEPVSFAGEFYSLKEAQLLPRPERDGATPICIGGNGQQRTLPLVAHFADEWNAVSLTPEQFRERSTRLDALLREAGRDPGQVRRSMMTGTLLGDDLRRVAERAREHNRTPEELRARGTIAGTFDEVPSQLAALEQAGVQRIMLQWLDLDDIEGLRSLARALAL